MVKMAIYTQKCEQKRRKKREGGGGGGGAVYTGLESKTISRTQGQHYFVIHNSEQPI